MLPTARRVAYLNLHKIPATEHSVKSQVSFTRVERTSFL